MSDDRNLDDDISDIFGTEISREDFEAGQRLAAAQPYKMHEERCKACHGRGRFISYSGRDVGPCFKCKGKGVRYFRQSLEQREKAREQRETRKTNARETWISDHAEIVAWINRKADRFDFARAMQEALGKYGALTDNQLAACEKCLARDTEREAQWSRERTEREEQAQTVEISAIERAFAAALASGLKWPKLRLARFEFSPAGANSKNAGAIYVKAGDDYLGMIKAGKLIRSRQCKPEQEAEIIAVCADPEKAAVAYGVMTGACSCCGRELSNPESVARGIGPICAMKWGW